MPTLTFACHTGTTTSNARIDVTNAIVGGWSGRNESDLNHHIEELKALGVTPPTSVPMFYRVAADLVTQSEKIQVLGPDTSGEVEWVVVAMEDGLWVTLGSDHTDRKAEAAGVALSKQLCCKVLGRDAWRYDDLADHWDAIEIRAWADIAGQRVLYQQGTFAEIRPAREMMDRYAKAYGNGQPLGSGTIMFGGAIPAIGGIRPGTRFEMEIKDPRSGRSMRHAYDIEALPVIV